MDRSAETLAGKLSLFQAPHSGTRTGVAQMTGIPTGPACAATVQDIIREKVSRITPHTHQMPEISAGMIFRFAVGTARGTGRA
jgi:hypothetical protein